MPRVLLATFTLMPDGEPEGHLLVEALARRGVESAWAVWDDPAVAWSAADLVAVRATWDYTRRTAEFLAWTRAVESATTLLNGAELFAWNADKRYLLELGEHVPCIPTALLDDRSLVTGLTEAAGRWGTAVVKPRVGASGIGVVVVTGAQDARLQLLAPGPWVVQPLVESVRTVGESSVYVFGGRAASQVDKHPAGGGSEEIRVHGAYGGSSVAVPLDGARAELAEATVAAVGESQGRVAAYARVDLMWWREAWAVSEVELIEPGLYLDIQPGNAEPFSDLVTNMTG